MSRFLDTTTRKLDDAHLFQSLVLGGRDHRRGAGGRVRVDRRGLDHIAAGRAARRGLDGTARPRVLSRAAERPIVTACTPQSNAAYRRYLRRFWPATALYVAAIALATWLIPDGASANVLTVGIALLPGLGIVAMIWAMARLLIELDDEYLRMLEVRKSLIATAVALTVASVWGILELYTDVPKLPVFLIFPIWCGGLAIGQLWNRIAGA